MKANSTAVVALLAAGSAGLALLGSPVLRAAAAEGDLQSGVRSVTSALALIERNYAEPVSSEKLMYQGAIPGMLHTLDPHSSFLDPGEWREMQSRQSAQYFGVGMEINMDGAMVIVAQPMPGSPALAAGLRRGDVIVAIDGRDARSLDSAAVRDLLRGPRGTPVTITVRREGVSEPLVMTVVRAAIQTSFVDAFWLRRGIAYLGISTFEAQNVAADVEAALLKLGEPTITGLVLDLRGNPGGLVTEAVAVAGRYLRSGQTVVSDHGRAQAEQVFRAKAQPNGQKYPMVVLVDRHSASAAEIVAGALQDHDRAWLIGENTFGKGLVQGQYPLSEDAALLLTIAHYYTPSGRLIQRDYQHRSFFDYYYAGRNDTPDLSDVKETDSGRKVYGGGGITPDEKYSPQRATPLEHRLAVSGAFFHFGGQYFSGRTPELPEGWAPDDMVLGSFRGYLSGQQFPVTDSEFAADREWIGNQLRLELYSRAFGKQGANQAALQTDPEVIHAIDSLPKAQALFEQAQHVLVRRAQR